MASKPPAPSKRAFEEFYEGFTNCRATQEGIKDEKISSKTKKTLDTYFKRAYSSRPVPVAAERLPAPYATLLPLQDKSGKWNDLSAVLRCLDMPEGSSLGQNLDEWEEATVFGIAAIRQRPELADKLMDAHDRAFQWVSSRGYITMAIEMIFNFREPDYRKSYKAGHDRTGLPKAQLSDFGDSTVAPSVGNASSTSHMSTVHSGSTIDGRASVIVPEVEVSGIIGAPPSLQQVLRGDRGDKQEASEKADSLLRQQQEEVVRQAAEFDSCCAEVRRCADRCIRSFQTAKTHELRNQSFDELTVILGPGLRPLPGIPDWRRHGAPSFRATCIALLCAVHRLAERRLDAEEAMLNWKGRPAVEPELISELKDARWTFSWEGSDLVLKVLHSLDWLQSNPYISGWFGRPFSLCANPLALPMNLVDLFNSLQMEQKVHEQLVMRPFRRSLCGVDGPSSAWKQREYLLKWQPKFEEACVAARLSSLWPVNPDTMHYEDCESIHTALVVLFVKGRVDIMRSVGFEKTTMSNSALKKSMNLMMKTALGPAGGKKSGKWRGTMDLSTKDSTGSSRQSQSAGNLYAQVLPKLKRRPTMPWPEDESDRSNLGLDVALGETVGVESKLEAVHAPPPVIIDAPFEIHLSIKTSPEKKKKSKIKKVKKIKESAPVTMPDVIKLGTGKAKTISMAAASDFDSDDNSSSAASLRPPPKLAVLEPVALLTKSKKAKKNSKKGVRELLEAAKGAHVSSPAKKAHGVTSRTVGSPVEGQRPVISRASFPADIKLTRKVTSPSKKQNKK